MRLTLFSFIIWIDLFEKSDFLCFFPRFFLFNLDWPNIFLFIIVVFCFLSTKA